jgi:hypothetical protein
MGDNKNIWAGFCIMFSLRQRIPIFGRSNPDRLSAINGNGYIMARIIVTCLIMSRHPDYHITFTTPQSHTSLDAATISYQSCHFPIDILWGICIN